MPNIQKCLSQNLQITITMKTVYGSVEQASTSPHLAIVLTPVLALVHIDLIKWHYCGNDSQVLSL